MAANIRNLTTFALAGTGAVLAQEQIAGKNRHNRFLMVNPGETAMIFQAQEPVYLEPRDGMPLLILAPYSQQPVVFYLDRTVRLAEGTAFALSALQSVCHVQLFSQSENSLLETNQAASETLLTPTSALGFEQMYTCFYQESAGNFYFRGETHEPYELVYVDTGTLHTVLGGEDVLTAQQQLLIIDRNVWHMQYSEDAVSFFTISFSLRFPLPEHCTNKAIRLSERMRYIMGMMVQEQSDSGSYGNDYRSVLTQLLLLEILRTQQAPRLPAISSEQDKTMENALVDQAVRYISGHITQRLTLQTLSQALHISVSYLCRLFRTHLNTSPEKYITMIRLEECRVRLREGESSIGEIAQRMGYASQQHFSRQFRQQYGCTPSQYMRSLR